MEKYITSKWWPFSFGAGSKEIEELQQSGSYQPRKIYEKNEKIKLAIDALKDRTFAQTEDEHLAFCDLYHKLIESHDGGTADKYFILHDLQSYWDAQVKVEELYKDELKWAEFALQNIAGMGYFSTDRSVADYAKLIWGIEPMPTDKDELKKVRYDYESHNRCTI